MEDLKIFIPQTRLHWGDKEKNLAMFGRWLEEAVGAHLVILPEMFNTGFQVDPVPVAEKMEGMTIAWMKQVASDLGAVVTGSLVVEEKGRYYNRLVWMQPDGRYHTYDKRHLFRMAGEHQRFEMGDKKPLMEIRGWKVCPLVCYDLRFPVWSRNTYRDGRYDYDMLIYVANWPEERNHAWRSLLVARAIENQCYVAGVNRVGEDGSGISHSGDSVVLDAGGKPVFQFPAHEEMARVVILSAERLIDFRDKFRVGPDWDNYNIE